MRPRRPNGCRGTKGKLTGAKAATAAQTRLVHPDKAPDRGPRSRPCHVQSGNRQQASWLRRRCHPGRGCRRRRVHGGSRDRPAKKTGWPVRFELSDQTRQAIDDYLKATGKRPGEFLFTSHRGTNRCMTTRQYARLVSEWIGSVGLDPRLFGTHSLRPHESHPDLPADGQSEGRPAFARAYQDRKHGQVSRHRSR